MRTARTYGLYETRWRAVRALKFQDETQMWLERLDDGRWALRG